MARLTANTITGAVLAALGLLAFLLSFQIGSEQWGAESARLFPQIVAAVLLLLSLKLAFSSDGSDANTLPSKSEAAQVGSLFMLGLCYIFLIDKLGFLISTAVVTPLVCYLFGLRNPLRLLVTAIAAPVGLHVVFFELLGLFPPYGEWFDLLDVLQGA
jgi:hypothetical protein